MSNIDDAMRAFRIIRNTTVSAMPIVRLSEHATMPTYGSKGAAGFDLYVDMSREDGRAYALQNGVRKLFKTGLSIAVPSGHYARVAPRSGLAFKSGIDVMAGVIDEDYRGEIGVILINLGQEPFVVSHGDRIAQLIIEKYTPVLVYEVTSLDDTARGVEGFGSTG